MMGLCGAKAGGSPPRRSPPDEHQYMLEHVRGTTNEKPGICNNFLSCWPQYRVIELLNYRSNPFVRTLRGADPTPLALPYPFRTWPWTHTGNNPKTDKREVATILYFGWYSRASL